MRICVNQAFKLPCCSTLVKVIFIMSALCEIKSLIFRMKNTDYLQSAHLNKLRDNNTGVPGRLLECSEIYLEVGAYKYILDKLMICLT